MALIETSKKEIIIVDNSMLKVLKKFNWYVNKSGYAANDSVPRKLMHRLVMGYPKGNVDHINGNKLDNRKENLRLCNQSQNTANAPMRKSNKSGYKGVSWNKKYKKWEAYLTKDYKHVFLGYYDNKKGAAMAYNFGAKIHFGNFAKLNII